MPYIVATGTQTTAGTNYESTAVETIEDARVLVRDLLPDRNTYEKHCEQYEIREQLHELSESGGKIGPMQNGSFIDVQEVSPLKMAALSGGRVTGQMLLDCLRADDFSPAYDAFNDR